MNIEKSVQYAISIADDNYHGYSQPRRDTEQDDDCSTLTLDALKAGGFDITPATYTGNMLKPLLAAGFIDVAKEVNLKTGSGLKRGDVLLRPKTAKKNGHTAICIGNGQIVQAQSDYDGRPGDSSGREIRIREYYNSPFVYVLRYTPKNAWTVGRVLRRTDPMMIGEDVRGLQSALTSAGYPCGKIDGILGSKTAAMIRAYQSANGLTVDGKAGKITVTALGGVWK